MVTVGLDLHKRYITAGALDDAGTVLAELARVHLLPSIRIPDPATRALRQLLRERLSRAGFAATDLMGAWPLTISPDVTLGETFGDRQGRAVFFGTVLLPHASGSKGTHMQAPGFARGGPWFYRRLGTDAGLRLIRVLREGP